MNDRDNDRRIIYHNEIIVKVSRPVRERFKEICREQNRKISDLGGEVIKEYVLEHTPKRPKSQTAIKILNWMESNKKQIYYVFSALCFMMIIASLITIMLQHLELIVRIPILVLMVIVAFISAKIFYLLGSQEKAKSKKV